MIYMEKKQGNNASNLLSFFALLFFLPRNSFNLKAPWIQQIYNNLELKQNSVGYFPPPNQLEIPFLASDAFSSTLRSSLSMVVPMDRAVSWRTWSIFSIPSLACCLMLPSSVLAFSRATWAYVQ
jgi:hypothetical protein